MQINFLWSGVDTSNEFGIANADILKHFIHKILEEGIFPLDLT